MRGLHLVAILLVLVREHATEVPKCPGKFNVTGALPQDRPVNVGFSPNPPPQENVTYAWQIFCSKENRWLKPEECLKVNMTVEENGSTLRISWIPSAIDVSITVMRDGKSQCYKHTRLYVPEKPRILGPMRHPGLDMCEKCLLLPHNQNSLTIFCDVEGGAPPLNMAMFIDTRAYTPDITSGDGSTRYKQYKLTVDRANLQHRSDVRCEVMSPALVEPLIATAQVYIEVPPRNVTLTLNDVTIGHKGIVRCDSKGMRPAVNITAHLDGRQCESNRTVTHENETDTYDVTTTCSFTGKKSLHRKSIKCCIGSKQKICSPEKYLNILLPPRNVTLTLNDVTIGHTGIVRCESKGMRPAVNITAHLDGGQCVSNRTVTHENRTDTYDVTTTLECLGTKSLYRKRIKCCIRSEQKICSSEKYLNFLFPPDTVSANQSVLVSGQSNVTVRCSVSEANPSCDINWRVPDRIQRLTTERQLDNTAGDLDGRYAQISELSLQRNPEHNGQQIACTVKCGNFDVIEETVTLNIPGPPLITITPGIRITRTEGTVDDILKQAWFVPTTIGIAILLLLLLVIGIVVWRTRKRARKLDEPKGGADGQEDGPPIEENQGRVHEEGEQDVFQVGNNHGDGQMYASVVPRSQRQQQANQNERPNPGSDQSVHQGASNHGDGQMYASVLPRSQRQQQANQNEVQPSGSNQLVYVELDFQPTKPASKPEAGSHVESNATDYVSIDFNKTAQVNSGSDKTPYMNM